MYGFVANYYNQLGYISCSMLDIMKHAFGVSRIRSKLFTAWSIKEGSVVEKQHIQPIHYHFHEYMLPG